MLFTDSGKERGRWSLWCIIHLFHVAYMLFTDSGKERGRWSLWCIIHLFHVAYMLFTDSGKERGTWSLWCIIHLFVVYLFTDSGKACMNMLRPGGQGRRDSYGSAAMARSSAVRDAKYLSHVTHI